MSMTKPTIFTGAAVAVVTPFRNGQIDYPAFDRILEDQIARGTDAIVVAGTTGEAATLTHEEHCDLVAHAVETVAGRVPVIAGTGSNDTAYGIELSRAACDAGADALLLVTPYYNKATPKGLIKNFMETADATNKPIILYNVPSRTGVNIPLSVYKELAKHERIVAVKEASGNISAVAALAAECGRDLDIYSGNDDQIVPILSLGGKGVISVLSNVMPKETHDIVADYLGGNAARATEMQLKLLDLIDALFCEVNPIPAKAAMAAMGFGENYLRLPLTPMDPAKEAAMLELMRAEGLKV